MDFATQTQTDGSLYIEIFGSVDEHAHKPLKRLALTIGSRKAVLDCAGIDLMNSIGVVYWLEFMKELYGTAAIVFVKCSISLVQQFNRVPNTRLGATVESLYAPFHCPRCDKIYSHLLDADVIKEQVFPVVHCVKCKAPMQPDIDADNYLSFG